ncbi:MAG: radical SAM protein [Bacteroidales bacterium]|nr:radical SAM protein [Bacteroidales bacterium]
MVNDWWNFLRKLTFRKMVNYLMLKVTYLFSLISRKTLVSGKPAFVTVEPTNNCNLRCTGCPAGNGTMERTRGNIDISLFKKLIDELAPTLSYLMLYFQGEPLLHPRLAEFIRYAADKRIYTAVSTNAHYLSRQYSKKIIESGLDRIIISLDGTDQESYSKYRQGGDFNRVLQGIVNLVQIKKEMNSRQPLIILQFIVMRHNEHQVKEVKTLGKKLNVSRTVIKSLQVYDLKNNLHLLPVNPGFSRYRYNKTGEPVIKNRLRNKCQRLWHTMVILQDGSIVPCCFDKDAQHIVGKYQDSDLSKIWKGKQLSDFRQKILNSRKSIGMCCNCTEGGSRTYIR